VTQLNRASSFRWPPLFRHVIEQISAGAFDSTRHSRLELDVVEA
jgi:hypothetical protein